MKVANQLLKSKQRVDKLKTLFGIIKNNISNILNSKSTNDELKIVIRKDDIITVRVVSAMDKLAIIEISGDYKKMNVIEHKLAEFQELTFDENSFKEKVANVIM